MEQNRARKALSEGPIRTFGRGRLANLGSLAQQCGSRGSKAAAVRAVLPACVVVLAPILALGAVAPGSALADLPEPAAQEVAAAEALEHMEEAEEGVEAAAAAPFVLLVAEASPGQTRRIEALQSHIERLRACIARIRASAHFTYHLPHRTTRFQVHLPKKRLHVKEIRARVHELRALEMEVKSG